MQVCQSAAQLQPRLESSRTSVSVPKHGSRRLELTVVNHPNTEGVVVEARNIPGDNGVIAVSTPLVLQEIFNEQRDLPYQLTNAAIMAEAEYNEKEAMGKWRARWIGGAAKIDVGAHAFSRDVSTKPAPSAVEPVS